MVKIFRFKSLEAESITGGIGAFTTLSATGATVITDTTASTSDTTGALRVSGGIASLNSINARSAVRALNFQLYNTNSTFAWQARSVTWSSPDFGIIDQSFSTTAQTFRLYTTYGGGGVDYERLFIKGNTGGAFQIGTEKGGTGSARALEFQTDGTTRFSISATAAVLNVGGGAFDAVIGRPNAGVLGFARADGATTYIAALGFDGTTRALVANSGAFIGWSSGNATSVAGGDTRFWRDAAGIVAQRNGATGQAFRIYNTDGTDFERLNLRWASNEFIIDAEAGGSGTLRGIKLGSASTSLLGFFGATPVVQQAAVADATDAASTQARLNDLLGRLRTLGLIAT